MAKKKPVFNHRFEAGEAMTVPFNLPGGRHFLLRLLGWGAALILAVYALFGRSFISGYKEFLIASMQLDQTNPDPEATLALLPLMKDFMWPMILLTIFAWVVFVMIETAMHKNVFRGTDLGLVPLRFGRDEGRVMLAQFVIFLCVLGVYILVVVGVALLVAIAAVMGSASLVLGALGGLLAFIGAIYLLGFLIHVMIRWAPAAAMSVRDDRQYIFEGWHITKGRGWSLFGSYLVAAIVGYIIIYVIMGLGIYLAFGDMSALMVMSGLPVDDPRDVFEQLGERLKSPRVMFTLVVFTILYILAAVAWYMSMWGIGNYAAQLDAREKGLTASA